MTAMSIEENPIKKTRGVASFVQHLLSLFNLFILIQPFA
jgi:hypothetical protein